MLQIALRILKGSNNTVDTTVKIIRRVNPAMAKGNSKIHKSGSRNKSSSANGQHKDSKMNHRMIIIMLFMISKMVFSL